MLHQLNQAQVDCKRSQSAAKFEFFSPLAKVDLFSSRDKLANQFIAKRLFVCVYEAAAAATRFVPLAKNENLLTQK